MSVQLVNGFVLFPHRANYGNEPALERRWANEVEEAEFGQESRFALRSTPRKVLQWSVTARDLQEQSQLADRIMAAKKSGLACAPHWGRGSELSAIVPAGATVFVIETSLWPWAIYDFIIFLDGSGDYEVGQLSNVAGSTLTLSSPLSRAYHSGTFVRPLIFGQFSADGLSLLTARTGSASLSIAELTSPLVQTIGTQDPPIDGIGGWIIEDTFIVQ